MSKALIPTFASLFLSCILGLLALIIVPESAWAGKTPSAIAFDATTNIEILEFYDTAFATQKTVSKALKLHGKLMKKAPGFKGFSVFKSQDGKHVIALSQWQDSESYQAYRPPAIAEGAQASKELLPSEPTRTLTFELVKTEPSIPGTTAAIRGKEAVVQLVEWMPKSSNAQAVVNRVEAMIPKVLQNQPAPQSASLLKAVEQNEVVLLLNWNCSVMFEDLGKPGEIAIDNDLTALASSEQGFYDVAQIIPAATEKPKDVDTESY